MVNLFVTADNVGSETGGGSVTANELLALQTLGSPFRAPMKTDVIQVPMTGDPFVSDQMALERITQKYDLAHFYAGTFSKTVAHLKSQGTKITYTCAAHDVAISRQEHLRLGVPYNYPHLVVPELWQQYKQGYLDADVVIAPSRLSAQVIRGYAGQNNRIEVIPHGIDEIQRTRPLPKTFKVGYLGVNCGPDKGVAYLLEAWKELAYHDATLVLAGRDSVAAIHWCRVFGGGNVHLAGWMKSPSDLYQQVSVYCQPSANEGFGLEVLEAMAHGRAVICSDGAGAADCVDHERTGLLVPKQDSRALARAIQFYRNHPEKMLDHGKNGQASATTYTWSRIRDRYCQVWGKLLGEDRV